MSGNDHRGGKSARLGNWLAAIFALAMFLGAGPGVLLVNQPATWLGFPRLYLWGLGWCTVEAVVIVLAYLLVWRSDDEVKEC